MCITQFNLNKLLEDIKKGIPRVEGEKEDKPEELIAQRLRSKRFLLVLDDIWEISNEDDWKRLLLLLKTSQEKGYCTKNLGSCSMLLYLVMSPLKFITIFCSI